MQSLVSERSLAIARQVVPAIVDSNTWNALHLSPGTPFILNFGLLTAMPVNFKVIAQVQHIPTPGDSSIPGVMTDYRTFAAIYTHNFTTASDFAIPLNYAWLRTKDDDASLASVRRAINTLPTLRDIVTGTVSDQGDLRLAPLYDRREMLAALEHEPPYLSLVGALTLGAITALLLALLGSLIASLLQAHSRLANFAVLRAIGATPRQIASILTWEQSVIYSTAVLLGITCGALLSAPVLPVLTFTNVLPSQLADQITGTVSSAEFYAAQNAPGIQIIIPPSLSIALGILAAICMLVLGAMIYTVSRPSIQQVLRLNED